MRDGQSRRLQGTENATSVFFSPDGTRIGFVRAGRIHVVGLNGGPPEQLCDAVATFGSGLGTVVVALGIIYVPAMARLVRSVTLVHSRLAYVDAGRAQLFPSLTSNQEPMFAVKYPRRRARKPRAVSPR